MGRKSQISGYLLSVIQSNNRNYGLSKKSFYRAFNAIYGKVGSLASIEVVVELLRTKCIPILLYGFDVCPVSSRQLRTLNYVVVSFARNILTLTVPKWLRSV